MKKTLTSLLVLISLASKAQVSNQLIASYNFDSNLNNAAASSYKMVQLQVHLVTQPIVLV